MKKLELKFPTGSVIKDHYGSIWIVVDHRGDKKADGTINEYARVVSFSHSNTSGSINYKTKTTKESCGECEMYGHDEACKICNGSGTMEIIYHGLDKCKLLANSCKQYILDRLTKNFDF